MNFAELIAVYGLSPKLTDRPVIRQELATKIDLERRTQETADIDEVRLLCFYLFRLSQVEDCLLIWSAKRLNFDFGCGLDVQLLCGAGLQETVAFLKNSDHAVAKDAHDYIASCVEEGDFLGFSHSEWLGYYLNYYDDEEEPDSESEKDLS